MKLIYQVIGAMTLLSAASRPDGAAERHNFPEDKRQPGTRRSLRGRQICGPAGNFRIGRKYALPPGSHQVKLVDPRFEEVSTTVELKEGKTTKLAETLKPLPLPKGPFGALRTPVPEKYAAVYINDKFYGHAGEFNNSSQKLMLPVGEYSVRVEPSSGTPINQKIKIEAGKTVLVH